MSKIKTAKQILKSKESYDKEYPTVSFLDSIEAMKEYGAYLIDLAAEKAQITLETKFDKNDKPRSYFIIDKKSILKIKKQIK
jgi:hypothetical protein